GGARGGPAAGSRDERGRPGGDPRRTRAAAAGAERGAMKTAEIEEIRVPRGALIGAGLLILATFALAITARVTGADRAAPRLPAVTEAIATRDLVFVAGEAGALTVRDGQTGAVLAEYTSTEGGFVHGALRGLTRLRERRDIPADAPYRL